MYDKNVDALKFLGKLTGVALLHVGVWLLVFFFLFSRLLATPDFLLESAQNNGVYQAAANEIAATTAAEETIETAGITLGEAEAKSIIGQVITPDFIQTQVETVVGSFYDWLEGNTPKPTFRLDASEERDTLVALFSRAAVKNLEDLPECITVSEFQAEALENEITCIPPQFNAAEFEQNLQQELVESDEFFAEASVHSEELLGQEFDFANSTVPSDFQEASSSWWYGILMLIIGAGILVNLGRPKARGARTIALQLLIIAAGLGVLGLAGAWLGSVTINNPDATELEIAAFSMIKDVGAAANYIVLSAATVCAALGVVGLALIKKRGQEPTPTAGLDETRDSTDTTKTTGANSLAPPHDSQKDKE